MMTAETISERLVAIGDPVRQALAAVEADPASSRALRDALLDLVLRHREARSRARGADPRVASALVRLLEAVADQALRVAEDHDGLGESTRQAVRDAHGALSGLESDVDAPSRG